MAVDLSRLEDSPHLIDLLIQMEDVLDSLDVYVFDGWLDGELISGPDVRRYWLDCKLRYDRKPDERGALRLIKHGVEVKFAASKEGERTSPQTSTPEQAREETNSFWTVSLRMPRRLITDMNADQIDFYDDEGEIDSEDVQDANDAGMNSETGFVDPDADASPQGDAAELPPEGANGR